MTGVFGKTEPRAGFIRGHPSVAAIGNMVNLTIPDAVAVHRHMRDCEECRGGWKILCGVEWEVPKGLRLDS